MGKVINFQGILSGLVVHVQFGSGSPWLQTLLLIVRGSFLLLCAHDRQRTKIETKLTKVYFLCNVLYYARRVQFHYSGRNDSIWVQRLAIVRKALSICLWLPSLNYDI